MVAFLLRHEIVACAEAGSLQVYEGNSPSGQAILVAEEDVARAEELFRDFKPIRTYAFRRENGASVLGRGLSAALAVLCLLLFLLPLFLLCAKQLF